MSPAGRDSAPRGAVFLSYASQDAEAATRMAASLRAAGIEVWFDVEGGLEQGDEWDAKIRQQIKDCVLFIAVVSANTQARHEGYFRIEWDLAAERARGIASGVPFILPVTIDGTDEQTALVPDRFKAVQWTKLPDGEISDKVQARFLKLWSHRTGVLKYEAQESVSLPATPTRPTEVLPKRSRPWLIPAIVGVIALAAVAVWQLGNPSTENLAPASASSSAPAPGSEAAQLLADAWELINRPGENLADLTLAEDYLTQANQLDPDSADIWAAWSQVDTWLGYHNYDNSDTRQQSARNKVTQAMKRAPHSFEARLAQACFHVRIAGSYRKWNKQNLPKVSAETEATLQVLLQEQPEEPRALYALAILQRNLDQDDEAFATFERLSQYPAWAATAWSEIGWIYWRVDYSAALEAANRSLAIHPFRSNLSLKTFVSLYWVGDLDAALHALNQMPNEVLLSDSGAALAVLVYQFRREPDQALTLLKSIPRDWLSENFYEGPKRLLTGQMHDLAGRHGAARIEFQAALRQVEQRLVEDSSDANLYTLKGDLLARLDQKEEARAILRLGRELEGKPLPAGEDPLSALQSGDWDRALDDLERLAAEKNLIEISAARLRLHPKWDPLRELPRFQALLAKLEADPFFSPHAPTADQATLPPAVAEPPEKSIAVLPFANLSPDAENAFFADGMHEDILTTLTNVRELKVISRTSTLRYRDNTRPLREVATELGVAHVLQGSVRRAGNRVRISAQLIEAATDENVWAETFDRDLDDVFAIQSEVAQRIASALHAVISPEERIRIDKLPTQNQAAYDLYLRGRSLWNTISKENNDEARQLFRAAIALDPEFALAWSALADTYVIVLSGAMDEPATVLDQGRPALDRALALDPNLAEAHLSLAVLLKNHEWDWEGAEREFQRALELNDRVVSVHHQYGWFLYHRQRHEEALVHFQRAVDLDPQAPLLRLDLAAPLEQMGRLDEAMTHIQSAFAIDPDFQWGYAIEGQNWLKRGNWERARDSLRRARKPGSPDPIVLAWSVLAAANAGSTEAREEAHNILRQLQALRTTRYVEPYALALAYTALNKPDEAFAFLNEAYEEGGISLLFLPMDPFLDPLRNDPRFQEIYDKMNFNLPDE